MPSTDRSVAVGLARKNGQWQAEASWISSARCNLSATLRHLALEGELLLFRPGARMLRLAGSTLQDEFRLESVLASRPVPLQVPLRVWLCGAPRETAEDQVRAANHCLSLGGCTDSGIRLSVREVHKAPAALISNPRHVTCLDRLARGDDDPLVVDLYLHAMEWPGRACPHSGRIFLSAKRLTRFALAHEAAHMLGMPHCAHVDENRYLRAGNVMEQARLGGDGTLTLGQILIMNLDRVSIAARLHRLEDPGFPLRDCLQDDGEPLDAPSLGFSLE